MACERTSKRVARKASGLMRLGIGRRQRGLRLKERSIRSVAASALRARRKTVRKRATKRG